MYMPIISSSLRALDCTQPIDGVRYLRSELTVECGSREQGTAATIAYVMLVVVGVGFPALLVFLLGRVKQEQLADAGFQGAWGFLYDGYRADNEWSVFGDALAPLSPTAPATPRVAEGEDFTVSNPLSPATPRSPSVDAPGDKTTTGLSRATPRKRASDAWIHKLCPCFFPPHLLWWEALVLLRKACIVLLAVLVTNPFFQCAGASIVLGAALSLHLMKQPFVRPIFNLLEGLALIAGMMTAIISSTLLQYNVSDPSFVYGSASAMSAQEWAITIMLALINILTLTVLASAWLVFQYSAVRRTAKEVIKRRKSGTALRPETPSPGGRDSSSDGGAGSLSGLVAAASPLSAKRTSKRRVFTPEPTVGGGAVFANPLTVGAASKHVEAPIASAATTLRSAAAQGHVDPCGVGGGATTTSVSTGSSCDSALPLSPPDGFQMHSGLLGAHILGEAHPHAASDTRSAAPFAVPRAARTSLHGSAIRSPVTSVSGTSV